NELKESFRPDRSSWLAVGSGPVTTNEGFGPRSSEGFDSKSSVLALLAGWNGSGSGFAGSSLSGPRVSSSSSDFLPFLPFLPFAFLLLSSSKVEELSDDPEPSRSSIAIPLVVTLAPGLLSPQPSQNLRKSSLSAPQEGHFQLLPVLVRPSTGHSDLSRASLPLGRCGAGPPALLRTQHRSFRAGNRSCSQDGSLDGRSRIRRHLSDLLVSPSKLCPAARDGSGYKG